MLDKALEQVDSAALTRQQAVRARGRYQTFLILLSAAFATLALQWPVFSWRPVA